MGRHGDFTEKVKKAVIERQDGLSAFCGVSLETLWTEGDYKGYAHHLVPLLPGGISDLDNCVYLCWGHHLLLGHGMAPFGIDKQGGGSDTWIQTGKGKLKYTLDSKSSSTSLTVNVSSTPSTPASGCPA